MAGAPTIFNDDILEELITKLAKGVPMTVICDDERMPSPRTVQEWVKKDPAIAAAIADAREIGFDAIAAEALSIADNVKEDPASRRVRADIRLRLLAKWDPKRYGDQLAIDHTSGGERLPESTVAIKIAALLAVAKQRAGENS